MKNFKKTIINLLLVVLMVVSFIPTKIGAVATTVDLYVIWNDANGTFHKKLIENVQKNDGDVLSHTYVSEEDIGDGYKLEYGYELVEKNDLDAVINDPAFIAAQDKVAYLSPDGIGITINPLRGKTTKTSKSHMGGMAFRFIVYKQGFIGVGLENVEGAYKPEFIGGIFYEDEFDIGGTTADKPAVVKASLLNNMVVLSPAGPTGPYKSVRALNVSEKAVQVNLVDGMARITFNSNYYDRVVFEVTTINNEVGYVMVARDTLNIENEQGKTRATLYYTKNNSYKDFQLVANITYNNGNKETKVLDPVKDAINDTNTDPYEYETDGDGENKLKKCQFVLGNTSEIKSATVNVVKKGATTVIDTYKGTFSGSKSGIEYGKIQGNGFGIIYYEGMVA